MVTEKEKQRFIKETAKKIHCPKKDKLEFLQILSASADDITGQDEAYGIDTVKEALGEPEAIAADFMETLDPEQIKKYMRLRTIAIALLVIAAVAVLIGLFLLFSLYTPNITHTELQLYPLHLQLIFEL